MDFSEWNIFEEGNPKTYPDIHKSIEMSDGNLIDTGWYWGGNWYLKKYRRTMCDIKYWRYIGGLGTRGQMLDRSALEEAWKNQAQMRV